MPTNLRRNSRLSQVKPISPERIAILIAVAEGPIDRRDIGAKVQEDSYSSLLIKTSTLYALIRELTTAGYLSYHETYMLNPKGVATLKSEQFRLQQQLNTLKNRLPAMQI
jgi:DNA-binding PadR family transcriptional regulator